MQKQLFWFVIILANIALAFIAISDPLRAINSDGVLYLETAKAYLQSGWHAAMHLYPWPFYSILIAWVSQGGHCSLELAAYFINAIFQILICLGFFSLACQIQPHNDANKSLFMVFTTLIILLYPVLNHHRDLIIRDFGYWAFSLWGWYYLIRLNEDQRWLHGIQFGISMLVASLFRLEGIVMLLFAPLAIFGIQQISLRRKITTFLKAYGVTVIFFMMSLSYFWVCAHNSDNFGRLLDIKTQVYSGVELTVQTLRQAKQHITNYVLTKVSIGSAGSLLVGGLVAIYIKMLVITLTPFYSILLGISIWKKQFLPASSAKAVINTAIFLNVFVTIIFLMQSLFLTERYLLGLSFLLLLCLPFSLLSIYQQTRAQKSWIFSGIMITIGLIALISLHNFGPSKIYLKQAGYWLHENLPQQGWVYTNSPQLSFYTHRPFIICQSNLSPEHIQTFIEAARQKECAYLVLQVKNDDDLVKKQLNKLLPKPIQIFMNNKGDAVWIYAIPIAHVK